MKDEKKAKVLSFFLTDEKSLVPILHNLCTVIKLALMRRGKSSFCIRLELESIGKASVWKLRSSIFESWEKMHWLFVGKWRIIFCMNHSLYSWRGDITWILSPKILAVLAYFDDNLFAWWVSFFNLLCIAAHRRLELHTGTILDGWQKVDFCLSVNGEIHTLVPMMPGIRPAAAAERSARSLRFFAGELRLLRRLMCSDTPMLSSCSWQKLVSFQDSPDVDVELVLAKLESCIAFLPCCAASS